MNNPAKKAARELRVLMDEFIETGHWQEKRIESIIQSAIEGDRVELRALQVAVQNLYTAGLWRCDTLSQEEQIRLWTDVRNAVCRKHATLSATLARQRGRQDTERMDWLEKHRFMTSDGCGTYDCEVKLFENHVRGTLREAIDAARGKKET